MLKLPKETYRRVLLAVIVSTLCALPSWHWYQDHKTRKLAEFIHECSKRDYFAYLKKKQKIKVKCAEYKNN